MKALLGAVLWLTLLLIAIIGSWMVWFRPNSKPVSAAKAAVAETIRAATSTEPSEESIVYAEICARIKKLLKSPRTAVFSELGKDSEATCEALGRGVFRAVGFVDSQNTFSALIRTHWIVAVQRDLGRESGYTFIYSRIDDETTGHPENPARIAAGLDPLPPPLTGAELSNHERFEAEKQTASAAVAAQREREKRIAARLELETQTAAAAVAAQRAKEAADVAKFRIEYHARAETALRKTLAFPKMAKFSSLQPTDDQFTVCRYDSTPALWTSRGIVDIVDRQGKKQRFPWRVVFKGYPDGSIDPRYVELNNTAMEGTDPTPQ